MKPSSRVLITSLVPKRTFMKPAMPPQNAPARRAAQQRHDHGKPQRQIGNRRPQRERRGGDAAHRDLALAADIGEVGAKRQDEAEADQRQRHGAIDRGADGEGRTEGAVHEGLDGVGHGLAAGGDQQQADDIEPTTAMKGTDMPSRRRRSRQRESQRGHATWPDIRAPMAPRSLMSAGRSPTSRPR